MCRWGAYNRHIRRNRTRCARPLIVDTLTRYPASSAKLDYPISSITHRALSNENTKKKGNGNLRSFIHTYRDTHTHHGLRNSLSTSFHVYLKSNDNQWKNEHYVQEQSPLIRVLHMYVHICMYTYIHIHRCIVQSILNSIPDCLFLFLVTFYG